MRDGLSRADALAYMLAGTLAASVVPLIWDLAGAAEHPFALSLAWKLGGAAGLAVLLAGRFQRLLRSSEWRQLVARTAWPWMLIAACAGEMDIVLFGLATRGSDVAVVTSIYQLWPLALAAGLACHFRRERRFDQTPRSTWPAAALAACGLLAVGAAQATAGSGGGVPAQVMGCVAGGLLACAVGGEVLVTLTAGARVAHGASPALVQQSSRRDIELCTALTITLAAILVGVLPSTAGIAFTGQSLAAPEALLVAITGFALGTLIRVAMRAANLRSRSVAVNLIPQATPALAVGWLLLFDRADVTRPEYLVAGAVAIAIANMLAVRPQSPAPASPSTSKVPTE